MQMCGLLPANRRTRSQFINSDKNGWFAVERRTMSSDLREKERKHTGRNTLFGFIKKPAAVRDATAHSHALSRTTGSVKREELVRTMDNQNLLREAPSKTRAKDAWQRLGLYFQPNGKWPISTGAAPGAA